MIGRLENDRAFHQGFELLGFERAHEDQIDAPWIGAVRGGDTGQHGFKNLNIKAVIKEKNAFGIRDGEIDGIHQMTVNIAAFHQAAGKLRNIHIGVILQLGGKFEADDLAKGVHGGQQ